MMVHKILNEQCPEILKQKFTKRSQVSKYETRRVNDLQIPRPRLEITQKSFSYKGAKVWNDIPNNIRNVESAALFKKQARNYFLGQQGNEDPLKHDLQEEQYVYLSLSLFLLFYYDWWSIMYKKD